MTAQLSLMIWQPNRAVVVVVGMLATAIVLASLYFMFDRPLEPAVRVMPVEIHLTSDMVPLYSRQAQSKQRNKPQAILKPLHLKKVENMPLKMLEPPSPPPVDWQQQIEMSVKSQSQNNPSPTGFMSNRPMQISPLQQALNAPRKPENLQNGGSYRSIYGGVMLKSAGICSELQTIQVGPSPSNRVTIAFPGQHCGGDYQPSMAEELSKWADQEAKKHPPP